jgi:hypothetical protein
MYDAKDFARDPEKYRLFKTAQIARHVFTNNGEFDLPEGKYVELRYRCTARNQLFRRDEPVYTVTADDKEWGDIYGNALTGFTL